MAKPIGIITDFGDSPYTGILRAVIRSLTGENPIDIDNSVRSFSVLSGAYVTANTFQWMPMNSVILVVVDPGVGGSRLPIAVETSSYYFVGPNNGVLYPAIARDGFKRAVELDTDIIREEASKKFSGKLPQGDWPLSSTFHGRDVFAPAAALISMGVDIDSLGEPIHLGDLVKASIDYVESLNGVYKADIVYIDKFGNVALSAKKHSIPLRMGARIAVETLQGIYTMIYGRTFSSVSPGELVLYVNSFGHLEIGVNQGNAAKKLGVEVGERVSIRVLEG